MNLKGCYTRGQKSRIYKAVKGPIDVFRAPTIDSIEVGMIPVSKTRLTHTTDNYDSFVKATADNGKTG